MGEIELHTAAMKLAQTSKRNDVKLALDAGELGAIPGSSDGWLYKPKNGAPILEDLENPGGWSKYLSAKIHWIKGNKSYVGHFTPR